MSRGSHTLAKRDREAKKAQKKREKAAKAMQKREQGHGEVPIVNAEEIVTDIPTVDEAILAMEIGAAAPRTATAIPCRLFVGGLNWETSEGDLRAAFGEFGTVADAVVVSEANSGKSRGFGFVTMENRRDAARAVEALNDTELNGRNIVVNVATGRNRR
jgi:RNA recognition motif-containing protein